MNILVISHNKFLQDIFLKINSKHNLVLLTDTDLKWDEILKENYDVIWSFHCKKIFPKKIVEKFKCLNIHPGLNPYNRGYAPHVFSMLNHLPCGITIHRIDNNIDHGDILYQEQLEIYEHETSYDVYERILEREEILLVKNFDYFCECEEFSTMKNKGNINSKKDYETLCYLNLENKDTLENHLALLRALSHGDNKNAYFFNKKGEKVFVNLQTYLEHQ